MLTTGVKTILNSGLTTNQAKQVHAQLLINALHNLESLLVRQILLSVLSYSTSVYRYVQKIVYYSQNPDAFSWSCTIRYLSQQAQFKEALSLYVDMRRLGMSPSSFAVSSALRACARIADDISGISMHAESYRYGFCGCVFVETALVDLYSKLGHLDIAQKVFDEMDEKNVVSWNSILYGYLKYRNLVEARKVFDQIPRKDVVSWNSMISGYAKMGDMDQASLLFEKMPERNSASWNTIISGYVDSGDLESARRIFDEMPHRTNVSWITMIAGYSKSGNVESASKLFVQMVKKDLPSYNAMISCFAQNSRPKEALQLFHKMLEDKVEIQPDGKTLVSVISACSQLGDLTLGSWVESYIFHRGMEFDDRLVTALIDLYMKCGNFNKAYELFQGLEKKDVVAYSAMVWGCGINGKVADAIKLFEGMLNAQIRPNLVSYTGILTACNHSGLVDEGKRYFKTMRDHDLVPCIDHYAIIVDLLGRAGRLQEAYELIKSMPMQPDAGVWGALLLACAVHNNVEYGEIAARHCFELEPKTTAYYSLLAKIYASVGRWDGARRLRKVVEEKKLDKIPGCSWMESI